MPNIPRSAQSNDGKLLGHTACVPQNSMWFNLSEQSQLGSILIELHCIGI